MGIILVIPIKWGENLIPIKYLVHSVGMTMCPGAT